MDGRGTLLQWPDVPPLILPPRLTAAGQARRYVADALSDAEHSALLATALLLTSELVANAVVHGAPPVTLRIFRLSEVVRIEVADGGVATTRRHDAHTWSTDSEGGRGLLLVSSLAADWGWLPHQHATCGQTSWFELEVA